MQCYWEFERVGSEVLLDSGDDWWPWGSPFVKWQMWMEARGSGKLAKACGGDFWEVRCPDLRNCWTAGRVSLSVTIRLLTICDVGYPALDSMILLLRHRWNAIDNLVGLCLKFLRKQVLESYFQIKSYAQNKQTKIISKCKETQAKEALLGSLITLLGCLTPSPHIPITESHFAAPLLPVSVGNSDLGFATLSWAVLKMAPVSDEILWRLNRGLCHCQYS